MQYSMRSADVSRRRLDAVRRVGALCLLASILLTAHPVTAAPAAQTPAAGEKIFQEKCTACHTIGKGPLVGPDLQGVTQTRDRAWLTRWIMQPDVVLAEQDPIAVQLLAQYNNVPMPNLGLNESQVAALLAYLESQAGGAAGAVQPAAPAALPVGDPAAGRALFMGTARFQNGGPPCLACHSIAGIGALGGGTLGPDLTAAFNKYGDAGLAVFLNTTPTLTMNAVWSRQPLIPQEQADLWAFLQQASLAARDPATLNQLIGLSVVGCAALLLLAQLWWRRRLRGVRRPMVARATH